MTRSELMPLVYQLMAIIGFEQCEKAKEEAILGELEALYMKGVEAGMKLAKELEGK